MASNSENHAKREKNKYVTVRINVLGNTRAELRLEGGILVPSDNAEDCQWRSRELK